MGVIDFSVNEALLERLAELTDAEIFFETGTFHGESIEIARRIFPRCMSVEMAEPLYQAARERFANDESVELFLGDSPTILKGQADALRERRVIYWLDAHWCTSRESAGEASQTPLIGELAAIDKLNDDSIVMIDDARLYAATPPPPHRYTDWPSFDEVMRALLALNPTHRLMILNDVILFYPRRIEAEVAEHAASHGVNWRHVARDARKYQRIRRALNFWR